MKEEKSCDVLGEGDHLNVRNCCDLISYYCHGVARSRGWWDGRTSDDTPTLLMLAVTELGEAMEAYRTGANDSHLPKYDGLTVEIADCIIRLMDMAGGLGLDLPGALADKLAYNATRKDHSREERKKEGGKKL